MTALSLPQRLLLAKWLGDKLKALRESDLLPEAAGEMTPGERSPAKFGGRLAGWVGMPKPSVTASVTSEAELLAWARKHHPGKVQVVEEIAVDSDVLALVAEHMPQAIRTSERVDPQWVSDLCAGMKAGRYVTSEGEILTEVPGISVGSSTPVPRVTLERDAEAIIAAAWRDGLIEAGDLLALPAPAEVPVPAEDEPLPGGLFTDADGYFYGPEAAAAHAIHVQGGYSTPAREARRMLADCRSAMMRCCAHCPDDCPSMMLCTGCGWTPRRTEAFHFEYAQAAGDPDAHAHAAALRPTVPHPAACAECDGRPQRTYDEAAKVTAWLLERGLTPEGDDGPAEVPQ